MWGHVCSRELLLVLLLFSLKQYVCEVKQRAAVILFSIGKFSQAEVLFLESGCDPREVSETSNLNF